MDSIKKNNSYENDKQTEKIYEGFYGNYSINAKDILEVKLYRFSLCFCSACLVAGISQWIFFGSKYIFLWLVLTSLFSNLSLIWIHIYIKSLHNILKLFSLVGLINLLIIIYNFGPYNIGDFLINDNINIILVGPVFASIVGIGFKEFFCFRNAEAALITLIFPCSIVLYIFKIISINVLAISLLISSILFFILTIKKFKIDSSSDIGDKSIFEYMKKVSS